MYIYMYIIKTFGDPDGDVPCAFWSPHIDTVVGVASCPALQGNSIASHYITNPYIMCIQAIALVHVQ